MVTLSMLCDAALAEVDKKPARAKAKLFFLFKNFIGLTPFHFNYLGYKSRLL